MKYAEWKRMVEELRAQWRTMWNERINDKVRAEGIANQDFPNLFVEKGTVIIANRRYRPPDFEEIVERHRPKAMTGLYGSTHPLRGGYNAFIRDVIVKQNRYRLADQRRKLERYEKRKKR